MNPRPSNMPIFALFMLVILLGMVISRATKAEDGGWDLSPSAQSDGLPPTPRLATGVILTQTTPRYYDQQLLNYRYTEFCATVKRPPKSLVEAIDTAVNTKEGANDSDIKEAWIYLHTLNNEVQKRCGDA